MRRCASAASDQTVLVCMAFWSGSWRGERTVALTVIPGLSPDKEAVHRFAEWCGREQLDPARLPEAIRAAFTDTVKTP